MTFPNIDPNTTAELLETLKKKKDSIESVSRRVGTSMTTKIPVYIRAIERRCSRPIVNPEFFKNLIEIPHVWTKVIDHSSSHQCLDKIGYHGKAVHPQDSKAIAARKVGSHNKLHHDAIYEVDVVRAQNIRV